MCNYLKATLTSLHFCYLNRSEYPHRRCCRCRDCMRSDPLALPLSLHSTHTTARKKIGTTHHDGELPRGTQAQQERQAQREAVFHQEKQANQLATQEGQASRNATRTAPGVCLFTSDQYEMTH
jgi:hypothetical protein